jgi:hypothetical protein
MDLNVVVLQMGQPVHNLQAALEMLMGASVHHILDTHLHKEHLWVTALVIEQMSAVTMKLLTMRPQPCVHNTGNIGARALNHGEWEPTQANTLPCQGLLDPRVVQLVEAVMVVVSPQPKLKQDNEPNKLEQVANKVHHGKMMKKIKELINVLQPRYL